MAVRKNHTPAFKAKVALAALMSNRTQLINQARGILSEFGIIAPQGVEQAKLLLVNISSSYDTEYPMELSELASMLYSVSESCKRLFYQLKHQYPENGVEQDRGIVT